MIKDSFENYHPILNFLYFAFVLSFSMVLNHPGAQLISFCCACMYSVQKEGKKASLFILKYCLPVLILTAFINPAFSHEGKTILAYLPRGNPLTLESIAYGFSAGLMMATVMLWFASFNRVISSDKFVYLFGKIIPALSLILSMTLRFIPRFKKQIETVSQAQRSLGRDVSNGGLWTRIKSAVTVFSIVVSWALENAIETAASMKSRGYGLKGRSAFSIYRFYERDKVMLVWLLFCGIYVLCGTMASAFGFRFFPSLRWAAINRLSLSFYIMYFGLCITPVVLNAAEERKWNAIHLKM